MRSGTLSAVSALCAAWLVAAPGRAQEQAPPTPVPTPVPSPQAIPGVLPERFRLPGAEPSLTPSPAPIVTPVPVAVPTPRPTAAPPRPRTAPAAAEPPRAAATPAVPRGATPTPTPTPSQTPALEPPSVPPLQPARPSAPVPPAVPAARWPWLGGGAAILLALAGWALWRRRRRAVAAPAIVEQPDPIDPWPSRAPTPPAPVPAMPTPEAPPFAVRVAAAQVRFAEAELVFELELEISNTQPHRAEAVRPALALISAHPGQDADIAGFHAASAGMAQAQAFDLAAGGVLRLPARMVLPRSRIHAVPLRGRPMFVALLMLDLRWRAGLSIRRSGADFLIGTAGGGERPGPIWLDRPAPAALAATAYRPAAA